MRCCIGVLCISFFGWFKRFFSHLVIETVKVNQINLNRLRDREKPEAENSKCKGPVWNMTGTEARFHVNGLEKKKEKTRFSSASLRKETAVLQGAKMRTVPQDTCALPSISRSRKLAAKTAASPYVDSSLLGLTERRDLFCLPSESPSKVTSDAYQVVAPTSRSWYARTHLSCLSSSGMPFVDEIRCCEREDD
jgi:hypothetical protein